MGPRPLRSVARLSPPDEGRNGRSLVVEALAVTAAFGGVRQVTLYANAMNAGAIALYESLGFVTYGVEPCGMQVDGVFYDEHLMVKFLDVNLADAAKQCA